MTGDPASRLWRRLRHAVSTWRHDGSRCLASGWALRLGCVDGTGHVICPSCSARVDARVRPTALGALAMVGKHPAAPDHRLNLGQGRPTQGDPAVTGAVPLTARGGDLGRPMSARDEVER